MTVPPAEEGRFDAVTWLTFYVFILYAIPSRLVISQLGSAGALSMLLGISGFCGWTIYQLGRPFADPSAVQERRRPVRMALVGFLVCVSISYGLAMSRPIEGDEISPADVALLSVISWSGALLVANDGIGSMRRMRVLVRRLAWAGAFLAGLGLVQFLTNDVIIDRISIPGLRAAEFEVFARAGFVRPSGTASHPIEFGIILAMLLPFSLHSAFYFRHRNHVARWLPVLVIAVALALTLSRSAYVSAVVALGILVIGWPAHRRRAFLLGAGALGLALFASVPKLFGTIIGLFSNVDSDPSISSRTDSYALFGEFFSNSPFFGRGLGTFLPKYRIFDNQYLGLLVGIGLIGTLAFLVLVVAGIVSALNVSYSEREPEFKDLGLVTASSIAAGSVSLTTFDGFSFPMTMGTLFLVLGLAGALHRHAGSVRSARLPSYVPNRPKFSLGERNSMRTLPQRLR